MLNQYPSDMHTYRVTGSTAPTRPTRPTRPIRPTRCTLGLDSLPLDPIFSLDPRTIPRLPEHVNRENMELGGKGSAVIGSIVLAGLSTTSPPAHQANTCSPMAAKHRQCFPIHRGRLRLNSCFLSLPASMPD